MTVPEAGVDAAGPDRTRLRVRDRGYRYRRVGGCDHRGLVGCCNRSRGGRGSSSPQKPRRTQLLYRHHHHPRFPRTGDGGEQRCRTEIYSAQSADAKAFGLLLTDMLIAAPSSRSTPDFLAYIKVHTAFINTNSTYTTLQKDQDYRDTPAREMLDSWRSCFCPRSSLKAKGSANTSPPRSTVDRLPAARNITTAVSVSWPRRIPILDQGNVGIADAH